MFFITEVDSDSTASDPYDLGFQSGICGRTLFECPYDHKSVEGLRLRHEWLSGYMTALAGSRATAPF